MSKAFKGLKFVRETAKRVSDISGTSISIGTVSCEPTHYRAGQYPVVRGAWEEALIRLFEAYAPERDNGWREYGEDFENAIFHVHYDRVDPECSCQVEKNISDWDAHHTHSADCFQPYIAAIVAEIKRQYPEANSNLDFFLRRPGRASMARIAQMMQPNVPGPTDEELAEERRENEEYEKKRIACSESYNRQNLAIADRVLKEALKAGVTGGSVELDARTASWMWKYLCTCGHQQKMEAEHQRLHQQHAKPCEEWWAGQPQFLHKPSGYGVHWYKYPCRDAYGNQSMTIEGFNQIIDECIKSVVVLT